MLLLADLPPGSALCYDDKQAHQNLQNSAIEQSKMDWWLQSQSCPTKYRRALNRYRVLHPKIKGKRRKPPVLAEFITEEREEEQMILDGVAEMMCERGYVHWKAKPKNGSIESDISKAEF